MKILITGADGFVGKNLRSVLSTLDHALVLFDKSSSPDDLRRATSDCDAVVHLAGVNRPTNPNEFYSGNTDLTIALSETLKEHNNMCPVIFSSSIQALKDNDYGKSKLRAEKALLQLSKENGNRVFLYRFKNLYGKWSKPNYNSVVATWCYNIARNLDITIDNPDTILELCYIDDVVDAIIAKLGSEDEGGYCEIDQTSTISLGELHDLLRSFKESRKNHFYPNQLSRLHKNLYATYLSHLPADSFAYSLDTHTDERGSFSEILKSTIDGQVSVNISKPGITKGQHWHSTKNEKFLVVAGAGVIQLRDFFSEDIIEYTVSGDKLEVIDIPTGYVHNIINRGDTDLVTLIWANELFDPNKPDTNYKEV